MLHCCHSDERPVRFLRNPMAETGLAPVSRLLVETEVLREECLGSRAVFRV
jgi:hypothetical protein